MKEVIERYFPGVKIHESERYLLHTASNLKVYHWTYLGRFCYVAFVGEDRTPNYRSMYKMRRSIERRQEWVKKNETNV